jgi:hypothetical protein
LPEEFTSLGIGAIRIGLLAHANLLVSLDHFDAAEVGYGWLPRHVRLHAARSPYTAWKNTGGEIARVLFLRDGRVGLNSVSVPIDGFPANYLHRLPWWGVA